MRRKRTDEVIGLPRAAFPLPSPRPIVLTEAFSNHVDSDRGVQTIPDQCLLLEADLFQTGADSTEEIEQL